MSSGTLGSPQLLMLSGIGPREHLQSVGIPCKKNLPVGEGLQDHLVTYIGPFVYNHSKTATAHLNPDLGPDTFEEYITNRTGEHEQKIVPPYVQYA